MSPIFHPGSLATFRYFMLSLDSVILKTITQQIMVQRDDTHQEIKKWAQSNQSQHNLNSIMSYNYTSSV